MAKFTVGSVSIVLTRGGTREELTHFAARCKGVDAVLSVHSRATFDPDDPLKGAVLLPSDGARAEKLPDLTQTIFVSTCGGVVCILRIAVQGAEAKQVRVQGECSVPPRPVPDSVAVSRQPDETPRLRPDNSQPKQSHSQRGRGAKGRAKAEES